MTETVEDFLDTEDLYFSKFARLLVAKFPLIRRIHIIFERAEIGDSFSNEMYIPTHPKNKIYIDPSTFMPIQVFGQFYSKLMFKHISLQYSRLDIIIIVVRNQQ